MRSLALIALLVACGTKHSGNGNLDAGDGGYVPDACVGLACFQYDCSVKGLPPTSVSGTVYAPNGTLPLYGVNVYVPMMDPGPLPSGLQCDRCDNGLQGGSLTQTTTDEAGHFTLMNVPATADVPVVIQIGKWRRQLKLANVAACQDLPIASADTTLPKSVTDLTPTSTGVDLPMIALSTGNADALECLILKLGIDPKEISSSTGTGHINFFADTSSLGVGATQFKAGWAGGSGAAFADSQQTLWNSTASLSKYDIVFFSCEGAQYPSTKTQAAMDAVKAYADAGGRVFMSHWHNIWIEGAGAGLQAPQVWPSVATWGDNGVADGNDTIDEMANPKGMSFATWMLNVGGSPANMRDVVAVTQRRNTVITVDPTKAERWVYFTSGTTQFPQNFQFTTPNEVAADQRCGKVVFSDMHVSATSTSPAGAPGYPNGCDMGPMTPQEKALAFMFFDIASCVGSIF